MWSTVIITNAVIREIVERIFGASSNPNSPINSFIILETTGSPIHPKAKLAIVIPN